MYADEHTADAGNTGDDAGCRHAVRICGAITAASGAAASDSLRRQTATLHSWLRGGIGAAVHIGGSREELQGMWANAQGKSESLGLSRLQALILPDVQRWRSAGIVLVGRSGGCERASR